MKKKIIGIVVLMLVATTVVSATKINVKEINQPTSVGVDVPVLEKGDSWTFYVHSVNYQYNGSALWYIRFWNCSVTATVTDDTGDTYTLKISSKKTEGRETIDSYRLKFTTLTKLSEEWIIRKTDFAYIQTTSQLKGPIFWLIGSIGFPFPAQYQYSITASYNTPQVFLPFPLTVGDGTLPQYTYTVEEKCAMYWGLITLINNPAATYTQSPLPYHCEMTDITVPAGTYSAYNVSVDFPVGLYGHYSWWQYYVPEVGYNAKTYIHYTSANGQPARDHLLELVSTTYTT